MLLLKFVSPHRQSVAFILRLVKLPVHAFHFGASLAKVPTRLLELTAKRTKLEAETISFGARLLQVMQNMLIERQQQVCLRPGSCHFAI